MGIKDSTQTRVKPLFDFVGSNFERLNSLLELFKKRIPTIEKDSIIELKYGNDEKKLPPPKSLLIWMIKNLDQLNNVPNFGASKIDSKTFRKREKLFAKDESIRDEAIKQISCQSKLPVNKWCIFEGYTHPDIFFETNDSIFVGEAKRTESDITTKTQWLNKRDQLVRHIDSFLDQPKTIYSFYILEKNEYLKGRYIKSMKFYENLDYFQESLKHREISLVERAKNSFIGYIFWEDISNQFPDIVFPDKYK